MGRWEGLVLLKGLHRPRASGMGWFRSPQVGDVLGPIVNGMGYHGQFLPVPL